MVGGTAKAQKLTIPTGMNKICPSPWAGNNPRLVRSMGASSKPASFALYSRALTALLERRASYSFQSTFYAQLSPRYKQPQRCDRRGTGPSTPPWPLEREDSLLLKKQIQPCLRNETHICS